MADTRKFVKLNNSDALIDEINANYNDLCDDKITMAVYNSRMKGINAMLAAQKLNIVEESRVRNEMPLPLPYFVTALNANDGNKTAK